MTFTKVVKFTYNNKTYQMFQTKYGQIAFLEVVKEGLYGYPKYEEFCCLLRLLCNEQDNRSFFLEKKAHKFRFTPKIIQKIGAVMLSSSLLLSMLTGCTSNPLYYQGNFANDDYSDWNSYAIETTQNYESKSDEEYVNDDFYMTDDYEIIKSSKYVQLFNNKYYDQLFERENVSIDEMYDTIARNRDIPKEYKEFIKNFVYRVQMAHPEIDFRVFHHNLKTLSFSIQSQDSIELSTGGLASYNYEENVLTIGEAEDVYNNPRSKIIFAHELGHLFNNCKLKKDGWEIKITFNNGNRGMYTKEALDVLLTADLYADDSGVEELESLGYAITTNNMRVIVACLPNYDITDSVHHSVYYFQKKLDEYMGDEMEGRRLVELLEFQWIEYSSELIAVDDEDYMDLYRYLTKMYIKSNLSSDMKFAEIKEHQEGLIYILSRGVSNPAYVYVDVIEQTFLDYMNTNGIETVLYSK